MMPKLNSDPILLAAFGVALIVVSLALRFLSPASPDEPQQ
jgi:hypothetical protein